MMFWWKAEIWTHTKRRHNHKHLLLGAICYGKLKVFPLSDKVQVPKWLLQYSWIEALSLNFTLKSIIRKQNVSHCPNTKRPNWINMYVCKENAGLHHLLQKSRLVKVRGTRDNKTKTVCCTWYLITCKTQTLYVFGPNQVRMNSCTTGWARI